MHLVKWLGGVMVRKDCMRQEDVDLNPRKHTLENHLNCNLTSGFLQGLRKN
jgi:hypothetical protein